MTETTKRLDYNSSANQRIISKLVDREVFYCVSSLVSHFAQNESALEGSDYDVDDILAICSQTPDHSEEIDSLKERREELETERDEFVTEAEQIGDEIEDVKDGQERTSLAEEIRKKNEAAEELGKQIQKIDDEIEDLKDKQEETNEAYEHWIVSDWAARKLSDRGEITGELFGLTIWGRCCTGQAIHLDDVWGEIAEAQEILEGQAHDWSKQE